MLQLKCEMCGSVDMIKQDGVFVCQGCGMKYSPEEAKNIMVEVEDATQNAVSTVVNNFLVMAEQAMDAGNFSDAISACDHALAQDVKCVKAWYIKAVTSTRTSSLKDIQIRASFAALKQALALVDDETAAQYTNEVCTWVEVTAKMLIGNAVQMPTTSATMEYMNKTLNHWAQAVALLDRPEQVAQREAKFIREKLMNCREIFGHRVMSDCFNGLKVINRVDADVYFLTAVKQAKPSADITIPVSSTSAGGSSSGGGCYVATAVYGSYDCPEVWTLRRYRDDTLAATWYGRTFIHTYYAISPTLVKWFGHTAWFKNMWKGKLDRMVADLQKKGVESTPYSDRNW